MRLKRGSPDRHGARIIVRRARHADLPRLVAMMGAANDTERGFSPDLVTRRFDWRHSQRSFRRDLSNRHAHWWVAGARYVCIGMVGCNLHRARHRYVVIRRHLCMHSLFVEPERRRAGAARRLVRRGLAWGQRQGAKQVRIDMALANRAVRRRYEAFGFEARELMFTRALRVKT
jgi:GNAT superfamily N-acetyltransferase